ncbi:MAG: CHAT domain-containing protein [Paracoccaceae bacterium]
MTRHFIAGLVWWGLAAPVALAEAAAECRAAAGLPEAGWSGVAYAAIDTGRALAACSAAVAADAADQASLARLARALTRAGRAGEAFALLAPLEADGGGEVLAYLATLYRDGEGVTADAERARALFARAAGLGNGFAAHQLAKLLAEADPGAAEAARDRAVALGYPPALLARGQDWRRSDDPERKRQAIGLLQAAQAAGEAGAGLQLGLIYHYGNGVAADGQAARRWYQAEIDRAPDDPAVAQAWLYLGKLLRRGAAGLEPDPAAAMLAFDRAGALGETEGWWALGEMAQDGEGQPADARKAVAWYRKAEAAGDAYSAIELGRVYTSGEGVIQDYAEAARWYLRSLSADQVVEGWQADLNLGLRYFYGFDGETNREEAIRLMQRALAAREDTDVLRYLGEALYPDADPARARRGYILLMRAAARGDVAAQVSLGYALANGKGTAVDVEAAAVWYGRAAAAGDALAAYNLADLHDKGLLRQSDPEVALRWLRVAAGAGRVSAQVRLAELLAPSGDVAVRQEALDNLLAAAGVLDARALAHLARVLDDAADPLHGLASGAAQAERVAGVALAIGASHEEPVAGCLAIAKGCGTSDQRVHLASAAEWFRRAAPLPEADYRLGRLLRARPELALTPDEGAVALARAEAAGLAQAGLLAALTGQEAPEAAAAMFAETVAPLPAEEAAALAMQAATARFGDAMIGPGWSWLRDGAAGGQAEARAGFLRVLLFYGAFDQALAQLQALPEGVPVDLGGADYTVEQVLSLWLTEVPLGFDPDPRLVAGLRALLPELARRGGARAGELALMLAEVEVRQAGRQGYVRADIGVNRALADRLADLDLTIARLETGPGLAPPLVALYRHRADLALQAGDRDGARAALLQATALGLEINDQTRHLSGSLIYQMERACTLRKTSAAFYGMGDAASGLAFAKAATNALQEARRALGGLPQDMQSCFRDAIADQYRALAGLMIEAGQLTEAQEVLAQLADFETYRVWQDDPLLMGEAFAPLPLARDEAAVVERVAGLGLAEVSALRGRAEAARAAGDDAGAEAAEAALEQAQEALAQSLDDLGAALDARAEAADSDLAAEADADLAADVSPRSIRRLQGRLARIPGLAMVYSVTLPERTHFLIVSAAGTEHVALDLPAAALAGQAEALRAALQGEGGPAVEEAARFQAAVWAPVEAALTAAGASEVLLALDRPLRQLPVGALHDGQHWLLEGRRYITFSPAGQDLILDEAPLSLAAVEALGASAGGEGFSALPNVALELRGIVRAAGEEGGGVVPGQIRLDGDFDEGGFAEALNGGAPVIHIASHFDLRDRDDRSVLLLGSGEVLSMAELKAGLRKGRYDMARLQMMVLSACQTALDGGAGLESFAAVLHGEGVQTVLATLWPVPDRSTALFMQRYYQHLARGLGRAEALRQTQLDFLASPGREIATGPARGAVALPGTEAPPAAGGLSHPRAWAGFQLIGQWR